MATGYTHGILDGSLPTFEAFAKRCIRAMGVAVHMRDEDLNADYCPPAESKYFSDKIAKYESEIKRFEALSDEEIIAMKKAELEDGLRYAKRWLEDTKNNKLILSEFLEKAHAYSPPSPEHNGIKEFMISQLTQSLDFEGDLSLEQERVDRIEREMSNIDTISVRVDLIESAKISLSQTVKELKKEEARIENSSKFVKEYFESIKGL